MSTRKQISIISRERFESLLLNKSYEFESRKELVRTEFDIDIPDNIQDGPEFVDLVYNKYLEMLKIYEIEVNKTYKKRTTQSDKEQTRKSFIADVIQEKKVISFNELMKIVDEKYGYGEIGKTPRVRVNKTLKELEKRRKIFKDPSGNISWKGDLSARINQIEKGQ